ncbi:hypothetical protein AB4305_21935 [Nocardia sp. 2YAB30]|uniref:hypothetical protein n=1 Tax=Nocardia sp. 2YAB30 TaxID=3233022 RepID=UPI003F9A5561
MVGAVQSLMVGDVGLEQRNGFIETTRRTSRGLTDHLILCSMMFVCVPDRLRRTFEHDHSSILATLAAQFNGIGWHNA